MSTGAKTRASHKIEIAAAGIIRIIFLPSAVDLCMDEFEELKLEIPFNRETPPNASTTKMVDEQWFCRLDHDQWHKHNSSIEKLVRLVDERWRKATE